MISNSNGCGCPKSRRGHISHCNHIQSNLMCRQSSCTDPTCHNSRHLAIEAGEDGADYVAFGAFYPTQTKDAPTSAEPDILDWWSEIFTLPCLAIGGITPENCAPLVEAGADFIAVSSFVWAHEKGPAAAISELNAAITEASA